MDTHESILLRQFEQARKVQLGLLPGSIADWNCLSFAYEYHSLDPIGGDYLDFFDIRGNLKGLLIADVSGHGIPAAIITAMAKMSFSNHSVHSSSPKEILKRVNEDIFHLLGDSGLYITAFFMVIDQDLKVRYVSAGHPPAIYYHNRENSFQVLKTQGLFIGAFEDAWETYEEKEIQLEPGDRLILYTDGIIEARNFHKQQYGVSRVEETVMFSSALSAQKLAKMVVNDVKTFVGESPICDDMSILVIDVSLNFERFLKHYRRGKEAFKQQDSSWVREYRKAFSYNRDYYEVAFTLGRYYLKINRYQEAKECFERLIANKIMDPKVYFFMGRIYLEEKRYVKALALFKDIVRNYPDFREAAGNVAYCYFQMGQLEKALEAYRDLIRLYPRYRHYKQMAMFIEKKLGKRHDSASEEPLRDL